MKLSESSATSVTKLQHDLVMLTGLYWDFVVHNEQTNAKNAMREISNRLKLIPELQAATSSMRGSDWFDFHAELHEIEAQSDSMAEEARDRARRQTGRGVQKIANDTDRVSLASGYEVWLDLLFDTQQLVERYIQSGVPVSMIGMKVKFLQEITPRLCEVQAQLNQPQELSADKERIRKTFESILSFDGE